MDTDNRDEAHRRLLDEIADDARQTKNFAGLEKFSDPVMAAMSQIPRHEFVGPQEQAVAYANRPQQIGFGQTISQPYIVALMTEMLDLQPEDTVLEIGTGSGYQAAVLSLLCRRVYSIETVQDLANSARTRLKRLGYDNVEVRYGDGYIGWPEAAPFDGILVAAAPEEIPAALCDQLKPEGRIIVPVGPVHGRQTLKVGYKDNGGKMHFTSTLPVAFVPMIPGRVS